MGKIFHIFANDLKTVCTNIVALVVVVGIVILPALYSWFNIASNWDPYSSTDKMPFAVCNMDKGYTYSGIEINAGHEIVEALKGNPKMGWEFVEEKEAREGVENGKYYAAVLIPQTFSENLSSITTGQFKRAELDYYVNEKKNAIAPKITNAGITAIESEVKSTYVNTVTKILATTLHITVEGLGGRKEEVLNKIVESLTEAQTSIDNFNSTTDVLISTLNMVKQIVENSKTVLPAINDALSKAGVMTSDVQQILTASKTMSLRISEILDKIVSSVGELQNSITKRLETAAGRIRSGAVDAAAELEDITAVNRKIISINNTIIWVINDIKDFLIFDTSDFVERLEAANQHQEEIIQKIGTAAEFVRTTGKVPESMLADIKRLSDMADAEISEITKAFEPVRTALNKVIDNTYSTLDDITAILKSVSEKTPDAAVLIDDTAKTVDGMIDTFESVKKMMDDSKKKLDDLKNSARSILGDNDLTDMLVKIISDPTALSDFFSQPVSTVTHNIYHVENYGTGMSPFYTSLGIWVGSIVLAAVVRAELTKNQKKKLNSPNQTQQFLGRYLVFFLLGELQALIISLGDLYFLGIQCNDHFLFVLGCMISALVYSMIVYSLTITLNVIGKALAVIILVLQVAGSGGTFPLEVLSAPFQAIAPFLPFRYGNDILREAIAGADIGNYWHNVGMLMLYVPFALLLGLLLRLPLIRLMEFFDKRLHQSELII